MHRAKDAKWDFWELDPTTLRLRGSYCTFGQNGHILRMSFFPKNCKQAVSSKVLAVKTDTDARLDSKNEVQYARRNCTTMTFGYIQILKLRESTFWPSHLNEVEILPSFN